MHFAQKELRKTLQMMIPASSDIMYGPSHAKSLVESLEPSTSQKLTSLNKPKVVDYTKVLMLSMTDEMDDIYKELVDLREQLNPSTRIHVITMSRLWGAFRRRIFDQTDTSSRYNWIPPAEIDNFFEQAGFEVVEQRNSVLVPFYIPVFSRFMNRWLSQIPVLRHLSVFTITTARPLLRNANYTPSVSIIVAARNEVGNIENLIHRLPNLSPNQELIFVEGGSEDQTWETIQEAIKEKRKGKSNLLREMFRNAKHRASDNCLPFDLTIEYMETIATDHCPVTGELLDWDLQFSQEGKRNPYAPSLDKIVPSLGYVQGNVAIISHRMNTLKSDMTLEQLNQLIEYVQRNT